MLVLTAIVTASDEENPQVRLPRDSEGPLSLTVLLSPEALRSKQKGHLKNPSPGWPRPSLSWHQREGCKYLYFLRDQVFSWFPAAPHFYIGKHGKHCGKLYAARANLTRHAKECGSRDRGKCMFCPLSFETFAAVRQHERRAHVGQYKKDLESRSPAPEAAGNSVFLE
ncbi:hypothetical protein QE152_g19910 [Popillia japonica]|uniref:C2H2-type domain-containing protein n=1 Tax=Popillia japonica TaxID=7064 RepID=A0AAW1KQU0_POPJA